MQWIMLLLAGVFEVQWACTMKLSAGFTKPLFTIVTFLGYIASAVFLSFALKKLPLGTAYAMWTGFGIVGTQVLGILLFQERLSFSQAVCVLLIAAGIAGLKMLSKS